MVQKETLLRVVDNSGVKFVKCLQVKKSSKIGCGKIGDILVVSVKSTQKQTKHFSKIKKGDIFYAVIVRTKKKLKKFDFSWASFFNSCVILINKNFKPVGNRIVGPVFKELRKKKCLKLLIISSGSV